MGKSQQLILRLRQEQHNKSEVICKGFPEFVALLVSGPLSWLTKLLCSHGQKCMVLVDECTEERNLVKFERSFAGDPCVANCYRSIPQRMFSAASLVRLPSLPYTFDPSNKYFGIVPQTIALDCACFPVGIVPIVLTGRTSAYLQDDG